jgi:sugar lactone lactonase YvrE
VDPEGNLFITESGTYRIRRVSPGGIITTVAGIGLPGFNCLPSGDGGPAIRAQLCDPSGFAVDSTGNVFIADTIADFDGDFRQIVRRVSPNGTITTVAGVNCFDFCPPFDSDGGLAAGAMLTGALSLAADTGRLLIADPLNSRVRVVSPDGIITSLAGGGVIPFVDGVPAISTNLFGPASVASDTAGNLFIAEEYSFRVRKVSLDGLITTVAGNGIRGSSGDGGSAINSQLSGPAAIAVDGAENLYLVDLDAHRIRRVSQDGIMTTVAGRGPFIAEPGG